LPQEEKRDEWNNVLSTRRAITSRVWEIWRDYRRRAPKRIIPTAPRTMHDGSGTTVTRPFVNTKLPETSAPKGGIVPSYNPSKLTLSENSVELPIGPITLY
jgi:hypothetical protein